jgi:hypothetical protein
VGVLVLLPRLSAGVLLLYHLDDGPARSRSSARKSHLSLRPDPLRGARCAYERNTKPQIELSASAAVNPHGARRGWATGLDLLEERPDDPNGFDRFRSDAYPETGFRAQTAYSAASAAAGVTGGGTPVCAPSLPANPVFKPKLAEGARRTVTLNSPQTQYQARWAETAGFPFGHSHYTFGLITSPTHPPRGPTAPHHYSAAQDPQLTVNRHLRSGNRPCWRPYWCPPEPRNRCVQAESRGGGAKVGAPQSALSPCVQARSGPGAPTSLLGATIRRSACWFFSNPPPLGADGGHNTSRPSTRAGGWPASPAARPVEPRVTVTLPCPPHPQSLCSSRF